MNQKPHAPSKQIQKRIMEEVFQRQENEAIHNPYEQELRELYSIEQGDEETLAQSISETYEGDFGVLAKDPLAFPQKPGDWQYHDGLTGGHPGRAQRGGSLYGSGQPDPAVGGN